jgi:hypothetical protein
VKVFESYEVFRQSADGWRRGAESDDILEHQISAWVDETKVLVVTTGPMNIIDRGSGMEPVDKAFAGLVMTRRETRTLAVIYVPPVEQEDFLYGEQPPGKATSEVRAVPAEPGSSDSMSARRVSDANLGSGSGPPGD